MSGETIRRPVKAPRAILCRITGYKYVSVYTTRKCYFLITIQIYSHHAHIYRAVVLSDLKVFFPISFGLHACIDMAMFSIG